MVDLDIMATDTSVDPGAQRPEKGSQREVRLIRGNAIQPPSQVKVLMADQGLTLPPDPSPPRTRGSLWAEVRHAVHPGRVSPLGDITLHPDGHHPTPDLHPGTGTELIGLTRTVQVGGIQDPR